MKIRKFKKEDAKKVYFLIRKTLLFIQHKYTKRIIKNMLDKNKPKVLIEKSKVSNIFVAVDKEKIVGTGTLKGDTIYRMFIDPNKQGMGIGYKMMEHIEKEAKKKGINELNTPATIFAVGFYEKMGFKKFKEEKSEEFGHVIIMKKKI